VASENKPSLKPDFAQRLTLMVLFCRAWKIIWPQPTLGVSVHAATAAMQ